MPEITEAHRKKAMRIYNLRYAPLDITTLTEATPKDSPMADSIANSKGLIEDIALALAEADERAAGLVKAAAIVRSIHPAHTPSLLNTWCTSRNCPLWADFDAALCAAVLAEKKATDA